MQPDRGYAIKCFADAARAIGKRKGGARQALIQAFSEISPVQAYDMPASMAKEFSALKESLTRGTTAQAAIGAMTDDEIDSLSRQVRALASRLEEARNAP